MSQPLVRRRNFKRFASLAALLFAALLPFQNCQKFDASSFDSGSKVECGPSASCLPDTPLPPVTPAKTIQITARASSQAAGYEAGKSIDGDANTAWIASLDATGASNNFSWILYDLSEVRFVSRISWKSISAPYPASGFSHYAIKISEDGNTWQVAAVHFDPLDTAVKDRSHEIGKNARYIRIESTKVNDASGWTASLSEVMIDSQAAKVVTYPCDINVTNANYLTTIANVRGAAGRWTNVCFAPGIYAQPFALQNAQFVRLLAQGNVKVTATVLPNIGTPNAGCPAGGCRGTLSIDNSHDIFVQGFTVENNYVYDNQAAQEAENSNPEISQALRSVYSERVTFDKMTVASKGKQTVALFGKSGLQADILITNSWIMGYYFILNPATPMGVYAYNSEFISNAEEAPADQHSMFYADSSDVVLDSNFYNAMTGEGLIAGGNRDDRYRIIVTGNSRTAGKMNFWNVSHGNYSNLKMWITGTYPRLNSFFDLGAVFSDPAKSAGSLVCRYSGALAPYTFQGCEGP